MGKERKGKERNITKISICGEVFRNEISGLRLVGYIVSYVMRGILCVTLDGQMVVMGFCGGCY